MSENRIVLFSVKPQCDCKLLFQSPSLPFSLSVQVIAFSHLPASADSKRLSETLKTGGRQVPMREVCLQCGLPSRIPI